MILVPRAKTIGDGVTSATELPTLAAHRSGLVQGRVSTTIPAAIIMCFDKTVILDLKIIGPGAANVNYFGTAVTEVHDARTGQMLITMILARPITL